MLNRMATTHVLENKRGDRFVMTLSGKHLFTGEGDGRIEQSFPSAAAATEHLDRVVSLRKRDGYAVTEVRELAGEVAAKEADPLENVVKHDVERGRSAVTFRGAKVPRGLCSKVVERLLGDAPTCVHLLCDHASPGDDFTAALRGKALPSIEAFIFDTHFQPATRQATNAFGDLAAVLGALPAATRVFVTGDVKLSRTKHDRVEELYLIGDPLKRATVEALGRCSFPALTTLGVRLRWDHEVDVDDRAVAATLRGLVAPGLATVHVSSPGSATSLLRALTESPLPSSWSTLGIDGTIEDEDALLALLEERAPVLRTLSELVLSLGDEVSDDAGEKARALVPRLVARHEMVDPFLPATYADW